MLNVAAKEILSSGSLQPRDNYVVCIVGGRHELFPRSDAELRNVTPLGDAVHAMTPMLGRGANLAMRDAALLGR